MFSVKLREQHLTIGLHRADRVSFQAITILPLQHRIKLGKD